MDAPFKALTDALVASAKGDSCGLENDRSLERGVPCFEGDMAPLAATRDFSLGEAGGGDLASLADWTRFAWKA